VVWNKKENMKLDQKELKEVSKTVIGQMNKYILILSEYSIRHSPAEIEAFKHGVNKGMKLMSEEK